MFCPMPGQLMFSRALCAILLQLTHTAMVFCARSW